MKSQFILIAVLIASSTFAQQSHDELAKLRESYTKAVERVTAPVKATYIAELKKLMEKQTKAGNLDGALVVKSELETMTNSGDTATPAPSTPPVPIPPPADLGPATNPAASKGKKLTRAELKDIEKRFVGNLWVDINREWQTIFFRNDGTATRVQDARIGKKQQFKWTLRDDGVVIANERSFTFPTADQGRWYVPQGTTLDVFDLKLVPGGKDPDK